MREMVRRAFGAKAILCVCLSLGVVTASTLARQALPGELTSSALSGQGELLEDRLALVGPVGSRSGDDLAPFAALLVETNAAPAQTTYPFPLPEGYAARWQDIRLDDGPSLRVLQGELTLSRTELGAEYYEYSAYLYRQLAATLPDPDMVRHLTALADNAEDMGRRLRTAASLGFDGLPGQDMAHLRVRGQLLAQLDELNLRTLSLRDVDQHGQPVYAGRTRQDTYQPGALMRQFQTSLDALQALPAAQRYPETMALVRHQARLMERLARHVELRWETVFYCPQANQPERTLGMKLFAAQSLDSEQVRLATHGWIEQRAAHAYPVQ